MKTKFLFFFFSFLFLLSFSVLAKSELSKSFAPVGTEWYYGFTVHLFGPVEHADYYHFVSTGDTLIEGRFCNTIEQNHGVNICRESPLKTYVSQSNDTVFLWVSQMNKFTPLYLFGAVKGDSWIISHPAGDVKVVVDSVSTVSLFGSVSKQQFVTYHYNWQNSDLALKSSIIKGIGDCIYLFNYPIHTFALCDDWKMPEGLICYSNPQLGSQKWTKLSCDTMFDVDRSTKTFLKDGYSWNIMNTSGGWYGVSYSSFNYTLKGDTIINSKVYKPVYYSVDSVGVEGHGSKRFYLREEAGRWYYTYSGDVSERLLYDFNLKVGATVLVQGVDSRLRILKVDSIIISGTPHKRLYIGYNYELSQGNNYVVDEWIEGIGSNKGLLYDYWIADFESNLLCIKKKGELVYMNPKYNRCWVVSGIENTKMAQPLILKSASNGDFEIQCRDIIEELTIYDIRGATVAKHYPSGSTFSFSLKGQPRGVFVLRVKTESGVYTRKIVKK